MTRWWSRLSGRGRWLALAGLLGAVAGAAAGWWGLGQIEYRAHGEVQLGLVRSVSGTPSATDALRLDEVVERELAELRRVVGSDAGAHGLMIEARRAEDAATRLELTATSTDPQVADDLRAVLAGYESTTALDGDATQAAAWNEAMTRLIGLRAEAAAARSRLAEVRAAMRENRDNDQPAAASPITETDPVWTEALWTRNEARRAAEAVTRRLVELQTLPTPDAEAVAALDPEAAAWWGRMRGLNQQLADAVWPPNPAMAERLRDRALLEAKLQARAADTRIVPLGDAGLAFRAVRLSETQSQLARLREAQAVAERRVAALEPRLTAWRDLEAQVQGIETRLALQEAAVAELDPGSGVRLIEAAVSPPTAEVWRDGRPAAAAWLGGVGLTLGVLVCALVFVFDKRVRRSRDGGLVGSAVPVLGAVPITGGATETNPQPPGEQPGEVSSIQSVRAVLESRMRPSPDSSAGDTSGGDSGGGGAFAITGIASGSGATSVAVGLAASLALSGHRVLLIDLAWLQKPAGTGTDEDATRDGLGIDGVIEELGYLDDEDREAIALGEDSDVGFGAILRGVSLRRSVVHTRVTGLAVLSAMGRGKALREEWAGRVSSRWLGKLMEVAKRGGYQATILDAGSATGSVEGMLGCAAADGTVVVVSGGQTQADYDKAVTRLRLVGATILGTVLNRSDAKRFGKRKSSSTIRRANAAGGTTGSGIFAAAIEARSGGSHMGMAYGGSAAGGSGMFTAPLPRVEDEQPEREAQADSPQDGREPPSIPAGVDPFAEPPATVQPTPARQPPRSAQLTPEEIQALEAKPPTSPASPETTSDDPHQDQPDAPAPSAPQIHVADDVMDQLVDHAIRAAQRPRPQPAPPAESSS